MKPLRIAYIANVRMPTEKAHGIQIAKMCEALSLNGSQVTLILPKRRNQLRGDIFDYYGIQRNFKVRFIPTLDLTAIVPYGNIIQTFIFLCMTRLLLSLRAYDVIYTREQFTNLFFEKCVYEMHWFPGRVRPYHTWLWNRCSLVVVITKHLKEKVMATGAAAGRILVAPDGVDLELFGTNGDRNKSRDVLHLPRHAFIVMYAGHLYNWKGAHVLARAAALLPEDVLCIFVGGTGTELDRFRKDYGSTHTIRILGQKKYTEIPGYLNAADVFVVPNTSEGSGSSFYTSPMKLFEYMASGRPIIASDLPSLREIVSERTALLVKPGDPRALADAILKLKSDSGAGIELVRNARMDVGRYSWLQRARSVVSGIEKLDDALTKTD